MKLGEFLEAEPDFSFDLEAHLNATRHVDRLKRRMSLFENRVRPTKVHLHEPGIGSPWEKSQPMDKAALRHLSKQMAPKTDDRLYLKKTMGTTGQPVDIYLDETIHMEMLYLIIPKIVAARGIPIREGNVHSVSLLGRVGAPDQVFVNPLDGKIMLRAKLDEREPASLPRLQELIARWKPGILAGKPVLFEQIISRFDLKKWNPPDLIISSGDHLSQQTRSLVEKKLGAPIANAYALSEVGLVSTECREGFMHVDTTAVHAEVLTEAGIRPAGKGSLLVTGLVNNAMSIVRYDTGDRAELLSGPCSCGAATPRIHGLEGRKVVNMRFPSGRMLDPTHLHYAILVHHNALEFRMTQTHLDRVLLEVELDSAAEDKVLDDINQTLTTMIKEVTFKVVRTQFPPGQPENRYLSRLY